MSRKKQLGATIFLFALILMFTGSCNFVKAEDGFLPPPSNLQLSVDNTQIDLGQNIDKNKNVKYEQYNKWVESLKGKLKGYNESPKLKLSWQVSSENNNIAGYKIFRNGAEIGTTEETAFVDNNFDETQRYVYYVVAFDAAMRVSEPSNSAGYGQDTAPPCAPQSAVALLNGTAARLSWTESTDDVEVQEYVVFRNGSELAKVNALTYDDTSLSSGTSYEYTVKAVDAAGNMSQSSNIANVTTYTQNIDSGLSFVKQNNSVILNWNKINDFSKYNLYRKVGTNGTFSRMVQTSSNTYSENSLISGTTYYYQIGYVNNFDIEVVSSTVSMYYSSGTNVTGPILYGNITWTSTSGPYTMSGSVTLDANASLKIMPGTVVKFGSGVVFTVDGKLEALGTKQYPIVFTSNADYDYGGKGVNSYNSWSSIVVSSYGQFTGDYTKIKYGGNLGGKYSGMIYNMGKFTLTNSEVTGYFKTAIYLAGSNTVTIKDNYISSSVTTYDAISISSYVNLCTIEGNTISNTAKSYGIYIRSYSTNTVDKLSIKNNKISTGRYPVAVALDGIMGNSLNIATAISDNTFYAPNNAIGLTGNLNSKLAVPKGTFVVAGGTRIGISGTLTLSPGTVLRLAGHDNLNVDGKIIAEGTAEEPVIFTCEKDSAYGGQGISSGGDYYGIKIESGGEFKGSYTKIKYGGNYFSDANRNVGIYTQGTLKLTNCEIGNSCKTGIYYYGGEILLALNTFTNNGDYAIYSSSGIVDASYNYWGSAGGPGTTTNAVYNTICTPWLGGEYDLKLHFGDEIASAGGNLSRSVVDMTMNVTGFELNLGRTYNSRDDRKTSSLGRGWFFSLEGSVKDYGIAGGKIVRLPDGSAQSFYLNGTRYIASDSRSTLTKQPDGTFILLTKDQYKYGFNASGYLVWMKDKNDNIVTITVDSNGKVTAVTDAAGRKINILYNSQNMINTITDPMGRAVQYEYASSRLSKVTDSAGKVTNYIYDSSGYLSEIRDGSQNLIEAILYNHQSGEDKDKVTQITDVLGNVLKYTYDNQNRTTTITDSNGRQTKTWYDILGYPIKVQDAEGKITTSEYYTHINGMNKFGEEKSVADRNGNKTQYIRDSRGNITKIINPDGSFKELTYDDKNNKTKEKDEDGKITYYIFDVNKINLIKKIQPLNGTDEYSDASDQTKFAITQYIYYTETENAQLGYSVKGLLKNEINPGGEVTSYTYDSAGSVITITDPEGKTTTNTYNQVGWKLSTTTPQGFTTNYSYDNAGRLEKAAQNGGETTRITYDAEGRKLQEISPNQYDPAKDDIANHSYSGDWGLRYTYYQNGEVKSVTDAENNVISYTYDLYGNVLTETKPNHSVYQYEYDIMNRLSKVWFKENDESSAVLIESCVYAILSNGQTQKTQTKYLNSTQTAVTVYTYDYAMRLVEQVNPDGSVESVDYNNNGTVSSTTDANGNTTYYAYDGLNRQSAKWTPVDNVNNVDKYAYKGIVYDLSGRKKTEILCEDGVALNKVPIESLVTTSYNYYKNGKLKSIYDNSGRRKDFAYDDDGNLSKEDDYTDQTHANTAEYIYNHLGKPEQKKVYVCKGDIFGNDFDNNFDNNEDITLLTSYTYDKNGNLTSEIRPDGVTTNYEYDNLNRQTKVSQTGQDEFGNATQIAKITAYNFNNKPISATDANGNTTKYIYNQRGLLEKIIDAQNGIMAYYYDNAGRKIAEVLPRDYDSAKALEEMNRIEYTYDLLDRLITKSSIYFDSETSEWLTTNKTYTYDSNGNMLSETDAMGSTTRYTYNHVNKQTSVLDPVSNDAGLEHTFKYEYDELGRKTSETNAAGVIMLYYYDNAGNLLKTAVKRDKNAQEIMLQSNTYDLLGNALTKTDSNGNTVTFEYNAFGKVRSVTYPSDESIPEQTITYQYDVLGNLKSQNDSLGTVDLFTYDNQGRELSHTQRAQNGTDVVTTSIKYDKNGNKRFQTDGNGNTKENIFDKLNRLKTETTIVSGIEQTTTYTYDKNGNITAKTDWRGNTFTNIYDPLNRLTEKKNPYGITIEKLEYNANNVQIKSCDALENIAEYTFDKDNRLISTIDPEGHITSQTYDAVGNVKTKTDGNGNITTYNYDEFSRLTSVVNAKDEITSYTYDQNGNLLTQTNANDGITTYEYNVRNKPTKRGDGSLFESYTYFADANLKTKTDKNGSTISYTYDAHKRLVSENVGEISVSYVYDKNGNRLSMADSTGTTVQTFDGFNRIKTKNIPNIGKTSYVYDIVSDIQNGNVIQRLTDPKGNIIEKEFDREDRLMEVRTGGQATVYEYYDNGSKKSVIYPDGSREEYAYYKDGLLKTLVNKKSDGSVLDEYSYTYDAAHNQVSKVDSNGETKSAYDALNRLESVTEPNGKVTTYTFDAAGNRATETVIENGSETITSYTYDNQNKLLSVQIKVDGVIIQEKSYTYDNNGNQLTERNGAKYTTNTYNELNELTSIMSNKTTIVNTYNGDGIRVAKISGGQTVKYLYEGNNVILELDGNGNQKAQNTYGTNMISRTVNGQTAYYFYNGHADVTTLIGVDGQVMAKYYYDAFGNLLEETKGFDNPYRYSGYQYDQETGTYYLLSRMYDPKTARFLQEDSYLGDKRDPLSLNLYTYCHNEPLMYWDFDGHLNVANGYDYDAARYGRNSKAYKALNKLTNQYDTAVTKAKKDEIANRAYELRKVADIQTVLRQLNYAGEDGKLITVDGEIGPNTAAALNYYTLKNKMNVFGKERREIDGVLYNAVVGKNVIRDVEDGKVKNKETKPDTELNLVYYNQADFEWGKIKYSAFNDDRWKTANGGKPQDIAGTGCGPTSMAMVLSSLTGNEITPAITAADSIKMKARTQYNGTEGRFFTKEAANYNIQVVATGNIEEVKSALYDGNHMVIASMGRGHFTGGGHYVVLSGIENNNGIERFVVMDPNMNNGRYSKYTDGKVTLTDTKGIVKANVSTVSEETNCVGYFIYSRE